MKIKTIIMACGLLAVAAACGKKSDAEAIEESQVISTEENLPGDSTLYGLACDGCTDSVVVVLPYSGGDPDTFDIIEARKARHVFGRPLIGSNMAIILNADDPHVADMVINIDELKGSWAYQAMPKMRQMVGMPQDGRPRTMPDSLRQRFMQPREYGIKLKREWAAAPIGYRAQGTSDDQLPVEYPPLKLYTEWRIFNGQIILTQMLPPTTAGDTTMVTQNDTATLLLLRKDTMVLQFADHVQGYYRVKQ